MIVRQGVPGPDVGYTHTVSMLYSDVVYSYSEYVILGCYTYTVRPLYPDVLYSETSVPGCAILLQ